VPDSRPNAHFTVVIPVKGTDAAKSRLAATPELARAIAQDTVAAALAVAPVIVVTAASERDFPGATVIADPGGGLDAAIAAGITSATGHVAVLLGDLPALLPDELAAALAVAETLERSFIPDADGTGTTLIASTTDHAPAFGSGSAARHRAAGYVEIELSPDSGLRRDVDTREQLESLRERLGPKTRAALPL
jgi:2-phospho-L-lactate guanylyltransferase